MGITVASEVTVYNEDMEGSILLVSSDSGGRITLSSPDHQDSDGEQILIIVVAEDLKKAIENAVNR